MAVRHLQLGLLFADICDSSRFYEELGDDAARRLVTRVLAELSQVAQRSEGTVVDQIGDELLCSFPDVEATALAAIEMQRCVERLNAAGELAAPVSVRVGLHFGEVVVSGDRPFGETVYTAKRMVQLAKGQQIIASEQAVGLLHERKAVLTRFVDHATIRGKRGKFAFHELFWDLAGVTVGAGVEGPWLASRPELELRYGDRRLLLDERRPVLTIGRGADCDLVVEHPSVSRHHGRIEQRRDYFVFSDHSTNGTHLRREGGPWVAVHRDEIRLEASGRLVLGPSGEGDAVLRIDYRCLEG